MFIEYTFNGYRFVFTGVTTWKMRWLDGRGRLIAIVPASWPEEWQDPATGRILQRVWFRDPHELAGHLVRYEPFVIAVLRVGPGTEARRRKSRGVIAHRLVRSTGRRIDDCSIETEVSADVPPAGTDRDFFDRHGIEYATDEAA
jgi:hypothetical protein